MLLVKSIGVCATLGSDLNFPLFGPKDYVKSKSISCSVGQTLGSKFGHAGFKFRLWGLPWWSSGKESTFQGLPWWFSGKESTMPMQETWVGFLIREDLTCHGAAKRMCHSYRARALEPGNRNY